MPADFPPPRNYIHGAKYVSRENEGYAPLPAPPDHAPPAPGLLVAGEGVFRGLHDTFHRHVSRIFGGGAEEEGFGPAAAADSQDHGMHIQLCRSCTDWSAGFKTEHSIANAYISAITNAQHFVYMENQVS